MSSKRKYCPSDCNLRAYYINQAGGGLSDIKIYRGYPYQAGGLGFGTILDNATSYDINIPPTEDFTDLSETIIHVKLDIQSSENKNPSTTDDINVINGFGTCLFDQVDLYVGSVNTTQANGRYHYIAHIEDLIFKHIGKADAAGTLWDEDTNRKSRITKPFELYFKLHSPLASQNNLLLNNLPLQLKFSRNKNTFVKLFPDADIGIQEGLQKAPTNYFITRNLVKTFTIPASNTTAIFENVFSGVMPRRVIVGFVSNDSFNGKETESPFKFQNFELNSIGSQVNGVNIPSQPYEPDFKKDMYLREFIDLYRNTNQFHGLSMLKLKYDQYKDGNTLFAFDYTQDGTIGSESGTLSLLKRGTLKIEARFGEALKSPIHMIVFAQFDNLIQIDKYRNVTIDW
ncbi:uncharacterized protein F54H12.2-like [Panonychus citri]|uniref:uncharacterized protein F54H12.2-like n=1 Tax=Panonychus citri TaxID=50023 RepID=UPI0023075971|nr:uncharacterized protein F54H12.2-like [Panonychus citri]